MEYLSEMLQRAVKLLQSAPAAQQAIVVQSNLGKRYEVLLYQIMQNKHDEERQLLAQIPKEEYVTALVCLWQGGQLDIPSAFFRRALSEKDMHCGDILVLLQGEHQTVTKKLKDIARPVYL